MRMNNLTGRAALCFGAVGCVFGLLSQEAMAAGTVVIGAQTQGPTQFIEYVHASVSGAALASVEFSIQPKAGSFTRPITAAATAGFLAAHGGLSGNNVVVPVFGLYAGSTNLVTLTFFFTDGSNTQTVVPIRTPGYTDPCGELDAPKFTQNRASTSDLNFDYFLLKDYCSTNSPQIYDTDGNLRWTGTGMNGTLPAVFYNNGIYISDGNTGVERLELYGGETKIGDYAASQGVSSTGPHNFDIGRNGILLDVSTTAYAESAVLEIDGTTGQVLNRWDMDKIIGAAMTAGGDNPGQFVAATPADWFHMNATTYNPSDNTLIVSSREDFVIAVDYDTPADGVKKIHWILGDTNKKWYQFPSLRKFALQASAGTLVPIGQHAVSIDSHGNLLLFNDGLGSDFQVPAGISRTYSEVDSYAINTAAMTATEVFSYDRSPSLYASFCSSAYEAAPGNYLVDYATANNDTLVDIQGLGNMNKVVFDLQFPENSSCSSGWNAVPLLSQPILYY